MTIQKNSINRFCPRAYDFPRHGFSPCIHYQVWIPSCRVGQKSNHKSLATMTPVYTSCLVGQYCIKQGPGLYKITVFSPTACITSYRTVEVSQQRESVLVSSRLMFCVLQQKYVMPSAIWCYYLVIEGNLKQMVIVYIVWSASWISLTNKS